MNSESNPGDKMKAQADRQTENTVEQGELDTKDDINVKINYLSFLDMYTE